MGFPFRVWLIRRNHGVQFIYRLDEPTSFLLAMEKGEVHGCYGAEPEPGVLSKLKSELYALVRKAVEIHEIDRQFPLRFLFSSVVFLFGYFFFSYVIRDPLPLVDEIVLSLVAAGGMWVWLRRRNKESPRTLRAQAEGTVLVDQIQFTKNDLLVEVELFLESLEDGSRRFLLTELLEGRLIFIPSIASTGELRLLWQDTAMALGRKKLRKGQALLKSWRKKSPEDPELSMEFLARTVGDFPLFVLHESLKV